MRRNRSAGVVVLASLLLGLPMAARGEILTWAMEGTIRSVSDPLGLIGFAQVGGRVRYTFTFDSDTPDTNPTPTLASYLGSVATFTTGTRTLPAGTPEIGIQRDPSFHANDGFVVSSGVQVDGITGGVGFGLYDALGTTLTSTALPAQLPSLSSFSDAYFSFVMTGPPSPGHQSGTTFGFGGVVDSFYAVPEPCSVLLFAIGGLGFIIRRR